MAFTKEVLDENLLVSFAVAVDSRGSHAGRAKKAKMSARSFFRLV